MTTTAPTMPGQSVSPPPMLTPRLGAMPSSTPLGSLALDPQESSNKPDSCDTAGADITDTTQDTPMPASKSAPLGIPEREDLNRSPSPALTVSNGPTSPPSVIESLAPTNSTMASPNPTSASAGSLPTSTSSSNSPKADVGFGSMHAEDELKKALSNKDRMFVLMLGKEFEAFIGRVHRGEYTGRIPPSQASAAASLVESLYPSKKIDVTAISKYQRMLTYKLAEWYGLRAAPGIEGSMVVGVLGASEEKTLSLRVSTSVPEATAPQMQQFRIMQREAPAGDDDSPSRGTSISGDDGTESSGPRGKSLQERAEAYALARKRIIGDDDSRDDDSLSAGASAGNTRSRQTSRFGDDDDDEMDAVPRRPYGPDIEFVYPSLYHPSPEAQQQPPSAPSSVTSSSMPTNPGYGYQPTPPPYQGGGYAPPTMGQQAMGYDGRQYNMPPYANQAYGQMPMNAYGQAPWAQQGGMGPGPMMGQQVPMMPMGQGWYPPEMSMAPSGPSMMPMIPQGMPYAPNMGYQGPMLAQPTPIRADPLSSTSSSISSRSYQDVHSRPHSRGSTTSTRSAASSVRLGAIYPTTQQPGYGYRQKAVKAQSTYSTLKSVNSHEGKRNGRQSPASTTSSRSSRRTSSIHIQQPQPGQHPLPQRPDWAANNVPYHPTALHISPSAGGEPSTSDFPPLHRGPGTNAEPMQIEKVKMRPNGSHSHPTVWSGSSGSRPSPQPHHSSHHNPHHNPHHTPVPTPPPQSTPPAIAIIPNPMNRAAALLDSNSDPDFPRRTPSGRTPSSYDPSAPKIKSQPAPQPDEVEMMASLSVDGQPSQQGSRAPSYAKIVRRD